MIKGDKEHGGMEQNKRQLAVRYFQQAYELQMKGQLDEAIQYYKLSIDTCPTSEAYTFLGWTYSFLGRLDDAIDQCYKAIQVDPEFGNPYNDIGAYLIEKGQLDDAVPWLKRAITAKRYASYEFAHMNLGRVYEQQGDWQQAITSYRQALSANPNYALAARALKRVQALLN
ncbi:MAG TPA: tetratricopeptide repeat protein [Nitrospiria bacterium]|nr:tetratricopeptide repeat protein [Nitrospiria bacterium]